MDADWVPLSFRIEGAVPLLMHNGQLADPMNPWAKLMSEILAKRKKTDADRREIARLEFMGGLYLGEDGAPAVPGGNIEGMFVQAAKKRRKGPAATAGLVSDNPSWPLIYSGPKAPDAMWAHGGFHDIRGACPPSSSGTVQRCRPIFRQWAVEFTVSFLPDVLDEADVRDFLAIAGRLVGLMDARPRFGRFRVLETRAKKAA